MNEEDVPNILLKTRQYDFRNKGTEYRLVINVRSIVNDDGVRDVPPSYRKCIFPDEPHKAKYKYYSFNVCIGECLKATQIDACNCTHPNNIYDG